MKRESYIIIEYCSIQFTDDQAQKGTPLTTAECK